VFGAVWEVTIGHAVHPARACRRQRLTIGSWYPGAWDPNGASSVTASFGVQLRLGAKEWRRG